MERDASLDEFLASKESDADNGAEQADSSGSIDSDSTDERDATDAASDPSEPIEPARSTGRWDPEGAVCEACGSSVARRWREEESFVCVECKSW
jgi:hypothetical protein